jgi:hypothetical protein
MLFEKPLHTGIGLGFLALGLPVYFFFRRRNRSAEKATPDDTEKEDE